MSPHLRQADSVSVGFTRATTLDAVADTLPSGAKIAMIKIDVDGAEPLLFRGGSRCLSTHEPAIFMEFAPAHLSAYGVPPYGFLRDLIDRYSAQFVSYRSRCFPLNASTIHDVQAECDQGFIGSVLLSKGNIRLDALP